MKKLRKGRRISAAAVLVAAAIPVAVYGSSAGAASAAGGHRKAAASGGLINVKFGLASINMLYAPYVVGEAAGIFAANHLSLSVVLTKDAATAETAVQTGGTPIGAIATDAIAIAHHADGNVAIMEPVVNATPYDLMTPKSIKSPKQLKGKTLAASALTTADGAIITTMLSKFGLTAATDYNILIAGDPSARTASLLNGETQGLAAPEPEISLLESKGFKPLIKASQIPALAHKPFNMIATNKAYAKAHPQTIIDFERAWVQSVKYMYSPANKAKVVAALAKALATPTNIMQKAYADWMVNSKVFATSCETPLSGLEDSIKANQASGTLTGKPPTPASLVLGGNYCSKASAG
jgi:ABC-type nitrate/sulfonate/bicarbonate transport system substrate-binding protein